MTDRIVKPVRAWANYDEWMWMLDVTDPYTRVVAIPLTGTGNEFVTGPKSIVHAVRNVPTLREMGPLRSLRVLYDNGYELNVKPVGLSSGHLHDWFWYLHQFKDEPEIPHGHYTEDKDSEAVERAMAAAATYFTQASAATLGTAPAPS
jgi:hypothetical protein